MLKRSVVVARTRVSLLTMSSVNELYVGDILHTFVLSFQNSNHC